MPNYSHGTKLALAAADEPPYLTVGTDVSAKYKGAFCEAKIIEVSKNVKVRVLFEGGLGSHLIDDTDLKVGSTLEVGAKIEAKHPEKKQQAYFAASITKILDHSRYTVVFDDGDRSVLRRSSICLKSGKHFAESETLDQLPLTNPEHFGNPVKVGQTTENTNNQNNCNHNNNHANHNNNTNHNNHQSNQSDKQSSSKLDDNDPGESKSSNNNNNTNNNNNVNKGLSSDNKPTPANGRAAATQNTQKQEISEKSASKTKTASVATPSTPNTPGRRGGKGRKAKDSVAGNPKLTEMVDDHEDSSQDSADADGGDLRVNSLIEVGVKLMVQYGKGKIQNVYEAKVNKIETNSAGKTRYFVHYTGWNNRYDEWVTKNRILSVVTDKENGVRDGRSKHSEATNSTSSSNTASSNSSTKESSSVKEKEVSTPAKTPRRSRLTETASTTATTSQTSTPGTASNPTPAVPTTAATPIRERDKSKDKNKEVPTKTRRTRNIVDSSANSAATSSSASSTSSVVSAAGQVVVKDEPKEKETAPASAVSSKPGRPRIETRESVVSTNSSSPNLCLTKDKDKEPPTKTRRSKQAEANSTSTNCMAATNESATPPSPPRLATVKTEHDKVKNSVEDTQHSATKEDRTEKPQHSEPVLTVKSRSATQNNQTANTTTKDKDTEKEPISVQTTKSRGSRQSESSHVAVSINPVTAAVPTLSTTSTTTKVATATSTVATAAATPSIATPVTTSSVGNSSPVVALVTSRHARDRERDKESDKEPPTKIRRSRQTASEVSEKTTTSNAATSATVSTTTTSSSTTSSNVNVANPSTASSASSSSSSSSSYSSTFSSNVMSAYNLIDKERFSDLPIIDEPDCDKRISILQDKIMAIKQTYMALRTELADLDRRKKRPRLERSNSDHINFSGVTCRN